MENNPKPSTVVLVCFAVLLGILGLTWIAQGSDFFLYKVFAPKYEQVRRQTFEQSKSYNQGMVQELENMQVEYNREKDPKAKAALASVILHRVSGYNLDDPAVSADLRSFISGLKNGQTTGGY